MNGAYYSLAVWSIVLAFLVLGADTAVAQIPAISYFDLSAKQAVGVASPVQLRQAYDQQFLVSSLEGLVNRDGNRLFVRFFPTADDFWWARMTDPGAWLDGVTVQTIPDLTTLLTSFSSYYTGAVVYDETVPATSNVAATVAGADNLLVLRYDTTPGSLYEQLTTGASPIPVKVWLINPDGTSKFTGQGIIPDIDQPSTGSAKNDAYRWLIQNYLAAGKLDPTQLGYYVDSYWIHINLQDAVGIGDNLANLDYIIAHRGLVFDLDFYGNEVPVDDPNQPMGTDLATLTLILKTCNKLISNQSIINLHGFEPWAFKYSNAVTNGWNAGGKNAPVPAEWTSVQLFTSYNTASDPDAMVDMANASFYQHYALPAVIPQKAPLATKQSLINQGLLTSNGSLLPTNYYAFYAGDYDSAAWFYNYMPSIWTDSARGTIPLAWAIDPNLADRFPFGMHWVRSTATADDTFVAGDDGAGYINPGLLTEPRTSGLPDGVGIWRARNIGYFNQWSLDTVGFVIDGDSPFMAPEARDAYSLFSPGGIVAEYTPPETSHNGMPILQMNCVQVQTAADMTSQFKPNVPQFIVGRTILWSPSVHLNEVQQIDASTTLPHKLVDLRTLLQLYRYALTGQVGRPLQTYSQWSASHFPDAPNLIANGSFENDTLGTSNTSPPDVIDTSTFNTYRFFNVTSSIVEEIATIASGGTTGTQCLQLDVNNGLNGNPPIAFGAYGFDQLPGDYEPTVFGRSYQLYFDAESTKATSAPLGVTIAEYDSSGNYLGQQVNDSVTLSPPAGGYKAGASGGFGHYTLNFSPASPTVAAVDIVFGLGSDTAGSFEANIDNVQYGSVTIGASDLTPEHDGVPNLLKYALNINPTEPLTAIGQPPMPIVGLDTSSISGTTYLTLTYEENARATGITYNVQTSPDLQTWTTVVPEVTKTVGTVASTGDLIIESEVNTNGASQEFIRLNVTSP